MQRFFLKSGFFYDRMDQLRQARILVPRILRLCNAVCIDQKGWVPIDRPLCFFIAGAGKELRSHSFPIGRNKKTNLSGFVTDHQRQRVPE